MAGASGDIHEIRPGKPGKKRPGQKRAGQGRRRDDRRDERGGNRGYRPKRKAKKPKR